MKDILLLVKSLEAIRKLKDEQAGELIKALIAHTDDEEVTIKDHDVEMIYPFIEEQVDRESRIRIRNQKNRQNATKPSPKRDETSTKPLPNLYQNSTHYKVTDNSVVGIDRNTKEVKESMLSHTKEKQEKFVAPTVSQVVEYAQSINANIDAQSFVDFYTSKGWMVGSNHMKDWKAAVRNWVKRDKDRNSPQMKPKPVNFEQRTTDYNSLLSSVGL